MRRGIADFREDADAWRAAVGARVPVYDRLLEAAGALLGQPAGTVEEAARARVEAAWRERRFRADYDRPLLLLAALRAEALRAGARHPLFAAIGAPQSRPEAATREALAVALADAPPRLYVELATRRVQTNETSRAIAWLWPAALVEGGGGRRPLALFDVGCSAGLNLVGAELPAPWTDTAGAAIPVATGARIVGRYGFDAAPLDVGRPEDVTWLQACIWPGETARLERLARAIDAFAARTADAAGPVIEAVDLQEVPARLEPLSNAVPAESLLLAYQTVVRDYLTETTKARYLEGMAAWVAAEVPGGPRRLWLELEAASDARQEGARLPMALDAHVSDGAGGARCLTLARCSYHPVQLAVDRAAVSAFAAAHRCLAATPS